MDIEALKVEYDRLRFENRGAALSAIADMTITPDTNHAELCALMIAIARTALGK